MLRPLSRNQVDSLIASPIIEAKRAAESAMLRPFSMTEGNQQLRIYFDNCSHSSGKLRAFCVCRKHERCTQHIQVETAGSRKAAIARLVAWLKWGLTLDDREEHSGKTAPSHLIEEVARTISE